ncbi:MAG: isopentenyl-diphosphate Delta-isomerase [Candidatus Peribacteraceae bacterium]|nr:isopentenyl-diphosphate Delta-isomerase [Candidatus Peribacteraceae bacterium]MDD5074397.1 isopentenyl-diphosphate Delta-isomerase [Candidatus Peribacteraceae bacterium]
MSSVLLCTDDGTITGNAERAEAHAGKGKLHRAFSVFVFRNNGAELLIQKRSKEKPLFPLIWANTCCSHLREGEEVVAAGEQRLKEEFGFTCALQKGPSFVYRAEDPGKRGSEYEYDTLLAGHLTGDASLSPDPKEVAEWKWLSLKELESEMRRAPLEFAPWFYLGLAIILKSPLARA